MTTKTANDVSLAKDGRGGFFAVDRRTWHFVCDLGMNAAVAYLVMARGTGGDNRTTKWSRNAVEDRTGISRSRAQDAINKLLKEGCLFLDPASKPSYPKYRIVPAHEIKGCDGFFPAMPSDEHERVHAALGSEWISVPYAASAKNLEKWGSRNPHGIAVNLVESGHATKGDFLKFRAIRFDVEAATRPDWIWIPNALVDGAAAEGAPVELVRQTNDVLALCLLVNLYGSQILDENGGIHFRMIRQLYERHEIGKQGEWVVWGFTAGVWQVFPNAPFAEKHFAGTPQSDERKRAMDRFWKCWGRLRDFGLVSFVAHLVHADTAEGEILHPVALAGNGLSVEQELGEAARNAGTMLITEGQLARAKQKDVAMLAPVRRHIEGVQMLGIARLRYLPRTNRTLAFMAQESEWHQVLDQLRELAARPLATSRGHQG